MVYLEVFFKPASFSEAFILLAHFPLMVGQSSITSELVESLAKMLYIDIDQHTGFMSSEPQPDRLPQPWEAWEILLDSAVQGKMQVGDKVGLSEEQLAFSKQWRDRVRAVSTTCSIHESTLPPSHAQF